MYFFFLLEVRPMSIFSYFTLHILIFNLLKDLELHGYQSLYVI